MTRQKPVVFHRALGLAISDCVLDVGTDLLIIGLPVWILWSVKIKPGQKFVIGIFLSLNLFMAIMAAIRVSGLNFRGTLDEVWLFLWFQIEASVAITMISLTAFRSVFVGSASSRIRREAIKKPWYSSTILRNRSRRRLDDEANQELPQIPSATLSGMWTIIRGGRKTTATHETATYKSRFGEESDESPLYNIDQQMVNVANSLERPS